MAQSTSHADVFPLVPLSGVLGRNHARLKRLWKLLCPMLGFLSSLRQLRQNSLYLLLSQILVIRLIYLHHRRSATGAEALDGEQGEFAVGI